MERNSQLKKELEKAQASYGINGHGNGDDVDDQGDDLTRSAMSLSSDEHCGGGTSINLFFKDDILSEYKKAELEEELKSLKYENQLLKQDLMAKSEQDEQIKLLKQQHRSMIQLMNQHNEVMPNMRKINPSTDGNVLLLENEDFMKTWKLSEDFSANQQNEVIPDPSETTPLTNDDVLQFQGSNSSLRTRNISQPFLNGQDVMQLTKTSLIANQQDRDVSHPRETTIGDNHDKESRKLTKPSKQDCDILLCQIRELEKTKETLSMMNREHVSTIEQLERQLLFGDEQKSKILSSKNQRMIPEGQNTRNRDEVQEEDIGNLDTSLNQKIPQNNHNGTGDIVNKENENNPEKQHYDGTGNHMNNKLHLNKSFDTTEGDGDDSMMFNQKFLLQSTMPDEKTMTMDDEMSNTRFSFSRDVIRHNDTTADREKDSRDTSDEEEEFKGCIEEGELSSEMEDIFLRYTKGEDIIKDPSVVSDVRNSGDVVDVVGDPQQDAVSVVAGTIIDVERPIVQSAGRFRSKEDLENTVDRQHGQIQLLETEKQALVIQLQDVQQIARDLSDEGKEAFHCLKIHSVRLNNFF